MSGEVKIPLAAAEELAGLLREGGEGRTALLAAIEQAQRPVCGYCGCPFNLSPGFRRPGERACACDALEIQ